MKQPLIVLTGPTAVGKTSLSISLAKAVNGEIISADSMQVYKKMDIGSAKIRSEEMQGIPHYLVDVLEPEEEFHIVKFQQMAKKAMEDIYSRGKIPILVGGTGFYIQAVTKDIDFTEAQQENDYRKELEALAEEKGRMKEFALYELVESLAGKMIKEQRNLQKNVCANVDFYSGFVYSMLGIPQELFTPIFAIARMPGWSAHRLEELTNANKIIRPAYKYVGHHTEFETMEERSAEKITDEDVKEEAEKCKKEEKGKK